MCEKGMIGAKIKILKEKEEQRKVKKTIENECKIFKKLSKNVHLGWSEKAAFPDQPTFWSLVAP